MAWYTSHQLRFRGRLVKVGSRYGCLHEAVVVKGKPLDFSNEFSPDWKCLRKLFERNKVIQREISEFQEALARHESY